MCFCDSLSFLCVLWRCVAMLYVVFVCEPFIERVARMVALCTGTVCGERAVNSSGRCTWQGNRLLTCFLKAPFDPEWFGKIWHLYYSMFTLRWSLIRDSCIDRQYVIHNVWRYLFDCFLEHPWLQSKYIFMHSWLKQAPWRFFVRRPCYSCFFTDQLNVDIL